MNDHYLGALPEGFAMALAQNIYALNHFASLPEAERSSIVDRARRVSSEEEMRGLVNGLIRH